MDNNKNEVIYRVCFKNGNFADIISLVSDIVEFSKIIFKLDTVHVYTSKNQINPYDSSQNTIMFLTSSVEYVTCNCGESKKEGQQ